MGSARRVSRSRSLSRRSEHVALAGGRDVLAAGEMTFARTAARWRVTAVTNQSTVYCPDPDSWPAVATALDSIGIAHPGDFTDKVIFRRCPSIHLPGYRRPLVRRDDFVAFMEESTHRRGDGRVRPT